MKASKRSVMKAKAAEAGIPIRQFKKLLKRLKKAHADAEKDSEQTNLDSGEATESYTPE